MDNSIEDDTSQSVGDTQIGRAAEAEAEKNAARTERLAASKPPVMVFAAGSEDEAEIIKGLLQDEGIEVMINSLASSAMGNIFAAGETRWGDVYVSADNAGRASALIAENRLSDSTDVFADVDFDDTTAGEAGSV